MVKVMENEHLDGVDCGEMISKGPICRWYSVFPTDFQEEREGSHMQNTGSKVIFVKAIRRGHSHVQKFFMIGMQNGATFKTILCSIGNSSIL